MSSLRLSKEHGLNPTVGICFWCGEDTGTLALLGASYHGEAPRSMVLDYEPCDKCKEQFEAGINLTEVSEHPNRAGQPPIQGNLYPTGRFCIVTEEAVRKIFDDVSAARTLRYRKAFLDRDTWLNIGLPE